jgi:hypothetical protein
VREGRVEVLSTTPLFGAQQIDASGLVVAPGFINLHWHGTDPHSDYYQAMDGITASFELEVGVADVDRWYDERAGRMPIHYGASIGHAPVRMRVMNDPGELLPAGEAARKPATAAELDAIAAGIEHGLKTRRGRRRLRAGLHAGLHRTGRSCACSGWPLRMARPGSCIFEAPPAPAAPIASKGCSRPLRIPQ